MRHHIPLAVLATTDPLLRSLTTLTLGLDEPELVVVTLDIHDGLDGGSVRRHVSTRDEILVDDTVPLAHACLSCSIREVALPTLAEVARRASPSLVVLALPVSAEPLPVCRALDAATSRRGPLRGLRLASVVAAVDARTFVDDLLGDDTLQERGLELVEGDERSVGEAFAAQVGYADVVVVSGADAPGRTLPAPLADAVLAAAVRQSCDLVEHVRGAGSVRVDALEDLSAAALAAMRRDGAGAERRLDPLEAAPATDAPTGSGVWTLELASDRPLHPDRLVAEIERLGAGRIRARGHFWVPTRPDTVCVWDGAGGQLSIGAAGPWGDRTPRTRLVITGVDDVRTELCAAFDEVLLTPAEHDAGLAPWLGRPDVLAPWLGDRTSA